MKVNGKQEMKVFQNQIRSMAYDFAERYERMTVDDFISAGEEGLVMAMVRFKEDKGAEFGTYAYRYIFNYMQKGAAEFYEDKRGKHIEVEIENEMWGKEGGDSIYKEYGEEPDWKKVDRLMEKAHLTAREEECLRRRCLEEESSRDIALSLRCTPQTVTSDIRRAMAKMKMAA